MKREYQICVWQRMRSNAKANQLGKEGWELVSAFLQESDWVFVFKRPLTEDNQ